jgi:dihydrolipoamide dehydrogenase
MDHISHLSAWAIERRETADTLLQLPFYHLTFEEGLKASASRDLRRRKAPVLRDLNDVAPPGLEGAYGDNSGRNPHIGSDTSDCVHSW